MDRYKNLRNFAIEQASFNNIDVVGAGWGGYAMGKPDVNREIGAAVGRLVEEGFVSPLVGARFPLEQAADALELIDARGATGKVKKGHLRNLLGESEG